jgi:hypothetical protein
MGNIKLHKQQDSSIRMDDVYHVIYSSIVGSLDDTLQKGMKMAETKLFLFFITLIGIPAYIYAYFLDIASSAELWKGVILTVIAAFTGIVIGCRQLVRLLKEWRDYKRENKN